MRKRTQSKPLVVHVLLGVTKESTLHVLVFRSRHVSATATMQRFALFDGSKSPTEATPPSQHLTFIPFCLAASPHTVALQPLAPGSPAHRPTSSEQVRTSFLSLSVFLLLFASSRVDAMAPLSEVHNQVRPARRPAVYGRRRVVQAETREMHRQLFGTDENDIEKGLSKLTINAEPETKAPVAVPTAAPTLVSATARKKITVVESEFESPRSAKSQVKEDVASNSAELETAPATKPKLEREIALDQSKSESREVTKIRPKRKTVGKKPGQPVRGRRKREMAVRYIAPCTRPSL